MSCNPGVIPRLLGCIDEGTGCGDATLQGFQVAAAYNAEGLEDPTVPTLLLPRQCPEAWLPVLWPYKRGRDNVGRRR